MNKPDYTAVDSVAHMVDLTYACKVTPDSRLHTYFSVGESVELEGGKFAVQSIGKNMVVLRALPGTHVFTKRK